LGSGDCKDQLALELRQLVHPVACVEGITQRLVLRPHPLPKKADDKHLQSHGREEDNRDDHGGQVIVIRHVKEMHGHGALDSGGAGELGHAGHRKNALDNLPQLMDPHQVTDALDQLLVDPNLKLLAAAKMWKKHKDVTEDEPPVPSIAAEPEPAADPAPAETTAE